MLQLGHRFYWPELGRFIQQDPIGDGVNWYAYVGNNPLVYIDPEGLFCWADAEKWLAEHDPVAWLVGTISDAITDVFWSEDAGTGPANPEYGDLLQEVRGGLPDWDAREATKHVLVAPFVATGLAAGGGKLGRIGEAWAERGLRVPRGARPARIRNKAHAVRVGDVIYNPHQHPGQPWHVDAYNAHKPNVHWQEWDHNL